MFEKTCIIHLMNKHKYSEFHQEFDSTISIALHKIAKIYHENCEAYDRTVCTGPVGRDGITPSNYKESGLINLNAIKQYLIAIESGVSQGIDKKSVAKAISNYRAD